MNIFTLALLTCSTFLYNSKGQIDKDALKNLELVVKLSKELKGLDGGQLTDEYYKEFFPNFVWIVRDAQFELEDTNHKPISEKEYLENALAGENAGTEH